MSRGRFSFKSLVLIGTLVVGLTTLIFTALTVQYSIEHELTDQTRASLDKQLTMALEVVSDRWRPGEGTDRTDDLADRLGHKLGARLTLITPQGVVIGDSEVATSQLARLENHADRPEVIQALDRGTGWSLRHSATLGLGLLYVAHRLGPADAPRLIVRLALPLAEVRATQRQVWKLIMYSLALAAVLSLGVAYLVARRVSRPVSELAEAVGRIASGDLSQRLREYPANEIGDLGRDFDRMADHLQREMTAVTEARDRLEVTLRSMVEGVLVLDGDGRAVAANRALVSLLNLSIDPLGRTPTEIIRSPELQSAAAKVLAGGKPQTLEIRTLGPQSRYLEVHVARLAGGDSGTRGAVAVFHDVTEQRRIDQVRRDFVANVSHELKTPLTAIRGSVETLLDGALENGDRARDFVEMIARHAERLQRLVEDLMDLARIESGRAAPPGEPVDLNRVVESALGTVANLAATRAVDLVRGPATGEAMVTGGADQLHQALTNLLDNAVKYVGRGGRVEVTVTGEDDRVVVAVADNGPGIDPEHHSRIFERFYRIDKNRSRELGGTGLGLAIVKHIAQAHGGRVELDSRLGRGAVFRLVLPRRV